MRWMGKCGFVYVYTMVGVFLVVIITQILVDMDDCGVASGFDADLVENTWLCQ